MNRCKQWLYRKFLPAWCREDFMEQYEVLHRRYQASEQENKRLRAYIAGLETAMRRCGRVSIQTGVVP